MVPALRPGDFLLVRWGARPRPGDVVVLALPDRPLGIKRLIGQVPGGWWVEGDNPAASTDSRTFGPVPDAAVRGRVVLRYWPLVRSRS